MISHLSLNYLSLSSDAESLRALREILRLYSYLNDASVMQQISGIRDLRCKKVVRRVGADADRFGAVVETIMLGCLTHVASGETPLPIVVRRGDGPVEVLIACDRRFDAVPVKDLHISVAWICEHGRQMCCVARAMPLDV